MSYIRGDAYEWYENSGPTGRIYGDGERLRGYGVSYMTYEDHAQTALAILADHVYLDVYNHATNALVNEWDVDHYAIHNDPGEVTHDSRLGRTVVGVNREDAMGAKCFAEVTMRALARQIDDRGALDAIADAFAAEFDIDRIDSGGDDDE